MADINTAEPPRAIQCLGCDAACEVYVELRGGAPVCLGGNNCPTGARFAYSQLSQEIYLSCSKSTTYDNS